MNVTKTKLVPWIIMNKDYEILYAHCTCMAGLGEACTHIAATLFYIEFTYSSKINRSVTDTAPYWIPVQQSQTISPKALKSINFCVPSKIKPKPDTSNEEKKKSAFSAVQFLKQVLCRPYTL